MNEVGLGAIHPRPLGQSLRYPPLFEVPSGQRLGAGVSKFLPRARLLTLLAVADLAGMARIALDMKPSDT